MAQLHGFFIEDLPGIAQRPADCTAQIRQPGHDAGKGFSVKPVRIQRQRRMRHHFRQIHHKRQHRHAQHLDRLGDMVDSERVIWFHGKRQIPVQKLGINAIQHAQRRADTHGRIHILRYFTFDDHTCIRRQEDEIDHLEGNGQKRTDAGQLQQQFYRTVMSGCGGTDRNGFTDEAVEQRHTGNRKSRYHEAPEGERHFFRQPAQLVDLTDTGRINDRAGTHEEQGFIQDMAESMRRRAVQRHSRSQPYAGNHEADLTDDMVSQQTPHIIFHYRITGTI